MSHLGILHGLGLLDAVQPQEPVAGPVMLKDLGKFPRSARAMSQVLKGEKNWWRAAATLRSELKGEVPTDPIGVWFHEGKRFEEADPEELRATVKSMKAAESLYFRLGAISAARKMGSQPAGNFKLSIVLGTDYQMVLDYLEQKDA